MSCGVDRRCGLDLVCLWLWRWCRPAPTALICCRCSPKKTKKERRKEGRKEEGKKERKKKERKKERKKKKEKKERKEGWKEGRKEERKKEGRTITIAGMERPLANWSRPGQSHGIVLQSFWWPLERPGVKPPGAGL